MQPCFAGCLSVPEVGYKRHTLGKIIYFRCHEAHMSFIKKPAFLPVLVVFLVIGFMEGTLDLLAAPVTEG